jgi:hypothetical protein
VQHPAFVGDLALLLLELLDELLEIGVRQRSKVRQEFHVGLSLAGVNLSLRL